MSITYIIYIYGEIGVHDCNVFFSRLIDYISAVTSTICVSTWKLEFS